MMGFCVLRLPFRICESCVCRLLRFILTSSEKRKGEAGFQKTFKVAKIKNQLLNGKGSDANNHAWY